MAKIIISCATTGSVLVPGLSGLADHRWGALRHLHARMSETVSPAGDTARTGGNVREGLEGSPFVKRSRLAASRAGQIHRNMRILRAMGHEPATPAEARAMLGLAGPESVRI